ncbi:MAG: dihydrofolate reductase family protein [Saprospiraceae bacterium]|nr:dihydrofolate reductase family protein [Saprospiraceae bacterium]
MRKLKLQMQVSTDGFVAGPNGEMDWMVWNWDDELKQYVTDLTEPIDSIILGRKLAEGFIPHWAAVAADSNHPEFTSGIKFTDTPKVVFTKTLEQSPWQNAVLAKGDLSEEITRLKNQDGDGYLMTYGGAMLAASLIESGLIDELHLFINPVAIGNGLPIFKSRTNLQLVQTKPFDCEIVVLQYALGSK